MREHRDDSLEELYASPEEEALLAETAALFERLPEPYYSAAFRQDLREKLLADAAQKSLPARRRQGAFNLPLGRWLENHAWLRTRTFGVVAAGLLLFLLALGVLNNVPSGVGTSVDPLVPEPMDTPLIADAGIATEPGVLTPLQSPGLVTDPGTEEPGLLQTDPESTDPAPAPAEAGEPEVVTPVEPAPRPALLPKEPDPAPVLPEDPDFDLLKNRRNFTLAGNVVLNYGLTTGPLQPVEKVNVNWEPNKIAPATTPNMYRFGTKEWAVRYLAQEGFRIKAGEPVSVKVQETTQGLFAEIVYEVAPVLVLHVNEATDIAAYYYLETGSVAPQGYYELMTPANALIQLQELKSSTEAQQLRFSFREVKLTYHEFLLEEGGSKLVRLPAYCFTGSELLEGKEGVTFYLPAVKF